MPRKTKRTYDYHNFKPPYPNISEYVMSREVTTDNKPEWPSRAVPSPLEMWTANTSATRCKITIKGDSSWSSYGSESANNASPIYYMRTQGYNSRLYATVYTKYLAAARQGSAELGMNVIQGRKALGTLVQLLTTSATTIAALAHTYKAGVKRLQAEPNLTPLRVRRKRLIADHQLRAATAKKDRRRLSNEIWVLDQVASTLLAYRYGVQPIMSDIASVCSILSEEFEPITIRRGGTAPWVVSPNRTFDNFKGQESVVLKATASTSNPNLALASRLGLTNPQYWLWDSTPWSHVIDWWVPVGSFLNNFTASVGLTFESASVTYTRSFIARYVRDLNPSVYNIQYLGSRYYTGKRKTRTVGSLPIPTSVPYGTGLGIQRAQNALAHIGQILSKKVKK